jgi:hypothetical protein
MPNSGNVFLKLQCAELDDSRLQSLTLDLAKSLRDENIGVVKRAETPPNIGDKGDPITIGTIVMTLIGSGGLAIKFLDVMKPYFERKPKLVLKLNRPDKSVEVTAESLSGRQLRETSELLNRFFED